MQSIEYRYNNDPLIRAMVSYLEKSIHDLNLTPSEIRDCAMLACINYERRHVRPSLIHQNGHITQHANHKICPVCRGDGDLSIGGQASVTCNVCEGKGKLS